MSTGKGLDGLMACFACMNGGCREGKGTTSQARACRWPCRSPWPGSAPLLGPLLQNSMQSPVVVSRTGQGACVVVESAGSAVCPNPGRAQTLWASHQGLPEPGASAFLLLAREDLACLLWLSPPCMMKWRVLPPTSILALSHGESTGF
ncbi:hypothetical protein HDV57DRAFT_485021 [Trichoderma longibrachiatum]